MQHGQCKLILNPRFLSAKQKSKCFYTWNDSEILPVKGGAVGAGVKAKRASCHLCDGATHGQPQ